MLNSSLTSERSQTEGFKGLSSCSDLLLASETSVTLEIFQKYLFWLFLTDGQINSLSAICGVGGSSPAILPLFTLPSVMTLLDVRAQPRFHILASWIFSGD